MYKGESQMATGDAKFLITDFLPDEGVSFFGALSGSGKTWFCLSMAKALTTGQPFLGRFPIPEKRNVVYLNPESGERSFHSRMVKFGIVDGKQQPRNPEDDTEPRMFLCRTMKDGKLDLADPLFLRSLRDLKPVVFLDTAIRFSEAESENDANQTAIGLSDTIFSLIKAGAAAVVAVHHSPKTAKKQDASLENTLRGSGDFGAMSDSVYSLKVMDKNTLRIEVENVKARDFEPVDKFEILGRPHINDTGDFMIVQNIEEPKFAKQEREKNERFVKAITENPTASFTQVAEILGVTKSSAQRIARRTGWSKNGTAWVGTERSFRPAIPGKTTVLNPSTTPN